MRIRFVVAMTAMALVGAGPCGPIPGGRLEGTASAPVPDWSFVGDSTPCAVEVRPVDPHSIRANCFSRDGELYVGALFAPRKRWPTYVAQSSEVRVKLGDRIYELRATRITDEAERARILSPGRPDDPPSASHWLYHLEPR